MDFLIIIVLLFLAGGAVGKLLGRRGASDAARPEVPKPWKINDRVFIPPQAPRTMPTYVEVAATQMRSAAPQVVGYSDTFEGMGTQGEPDAVHAAHVPPAATTVVGIDELHRLGPADLRRAVVFSEIIGPPRALHPYKRTVRGH